MSEWLSKIFAVIKSPQLAAWLFLVSAALLFMPDTWHAVLKLQTFTEEYGLYFGVVWIISGFALIVRGLSWLGSSIWRFTQAQKTKRKIDRALTSLDQHEKALLREFFIRGSNTLNLPIQEPVVNGLISKEILVLVGGIGDSYITTGILMPIAIAEYASKNLTKNHLGLPQAPKGQELTEIQRRTILNARPRFMKPIDVIDSLKSGGLF